MERINIEEKNIQFKQIVSGPAPVGRILNYIKPQYVHMMKDGKISLSGDYSFAKKIEENGYNKTFEVVGE